MEGKKHQRKMARKDVECTNKVAGNRTSDKCTKPKRDGGVRDRHAASGQSRENREG